MFINKNVSNRIAMLRPIMIFGVVYAHVAGSPEQTTWSSSLFDLFVAFFKNGVFRGTVPLLALVSGYLLFTANLDQKPVQMLKKKFITLAVPFMVFNFGYIAYMLVLKYGFNVVLFEDITKLSRFEWANKITGFWDYPANGPLHFVRDMMVTILLAPLLGLLIRSAPWMGLAAMIVIFGTDQEGHLILRGSSFILFYVGGMAAVGKWNILALDKYAPQCLGMFSLICLGLILSGSRDNTLVVATAPFLVWPSLSLLANTRMEAWAMKMSKYSFFTFVAHMPVLTLIWWWKLHYGEWLPYSLYWFIAPVITIGALIALYDYAIRYTPTAFNFAIGARAVKKQTFVDRRKTPRAADAPVYSYEERMQLINS